MAIVATGQLTIYDANDGTSVYTAFIYRKNETTPTTPEGGTYNFGTNVLTAPGDWLSTIPETTEITTWVSAYTFMGLGDQVVTAGEWSTPRLYAVKGVDNIAVRLSNESHIIPCDSAGNPTDYAGSGTNIYVYEGVERSDYLPPTSLPPPADFVLSPKSWYISNTTTDPVAKLPRLTSGTNITSGLISDAGYFASVGDASGMLTSAETASLKFFITGKNSRGAEYTLPIEQTFVKAKSGSLAATFRITNSGVTLVKGVDDVISPSKVTLNTALTSLAPTGYTWSKNGTSTSISTAASYDVPLGDYSNGILSNTYKCTVIGTLGGVSVTLSDEITIPLLLTDKPVPSVLLTDESKMFTAPATDYAQISFTGGDCGFKAYLGSSPLAVRKSVSYSVNSERVFTAIGQTVPGQDSVPAGGWAVFTSVAPPTLSVGVPYAITKTGQYTFTVDGYVANVTASAANSDLRVMLAAKGTKASFGLSSKVGVEVDEVGEVTGYSVCTLPAPTAMLSDTAAATVLCLIVGYDNKPHVIERKVTYSLSRAGTQGESGATVRISSDREPIFTLTDGVFDADQDDIVYTATVVGGTSSTGYAWTLGTTKTGTGSTFTVKQTDISATVKVSCTVTLNGKEYTDTETIFLQNDTSGATVEVSFKPRYIVPSLDPLTSLTPKIGYSLKNGTLKKVAGASIMQLTSGKLWPANNPAVQFTVGQGDYSIGIGPGVAISRGLALANGSLKVVKGGVTDAPEIGRYVKGDVLTIIYFNTSWYFLKNSILITAVEVSALESSQQINLILNLNTMATTISSIGFDVTTTNFEEDATKVGNVDGKITSENVGKVISDNAISSAQIGNITMEDRFRFGVSPENPTTGMTITPAYLAIYVGGFLRVKLGKLSS